MMVPLKCNVGAGRDLERIGRLALGTVQFGQHYGVANTLGRVKEQDAREILALAAHLGIRTLDTAIGYGDSETVLGRAGVSGQNVLTKLPAFPSDISDVSVWVRNQICDSLDRLNCESLYGVLLHRPAQLFESNGEELYDALQLLKTDGLTHNIGVSLYEPKEASFLFSMFEFELVQVPLNILDRRFIESGWAKKLKRKGVELHTRSAFLQGLLLMDADARPKYFDRWRPLWDVWHCWLLENNISPLQACLQYVLGETLVDRVVVGVDSIDQFQQIIDSSAGELPPPPKWPQALEPELLNPAKWNLA